MLIQLFQIQFMLVLRGYGNRQTEVKVVGNLTNNINGNSNMMINR